MARSVPLVVIKCECMHVIQLPVLPKIGLGDFARDTPLVFLDVETSGLFPRKGARINEIAMLTWEQTVLHHAGLNEDVWAHQCLFYLQRCVVVGHNVSFDLQFVADSFRRCGLEMPCVKFIDTRKVWLQRNKNGSSRLNQLAQFLGIDHLWHRAESDAAVCRAYLSRLLSESPELTLRDLAVNQFKKGTL